MAFWILRSFRKEGNTNLYILYEIYYLQKWWQRDTANYNWSSSGSKNLD
jgi:hypothetical protein